nr:alpha-2-macroglobulin family protein [uncultured Shimia sp.]
MRCIFMILAGLFVAQSGIAQQEFIPERRAVVSRDVDFYGSDLQNLFDTSYSACQKACLADTKCKAFTFNSRSNSCFPKSDISDRQPYDGAVSAEIFVTSSKTRDLATTRANDLDFLRSYELDNARAQAEKIGRVHSAGPWTVQAMIDAANNSRSKEDTLNAMRWTGGAVAKADQSDLWVEYGRLSQSLLQDNTSDKRLYRERALLASVNGYLRAPNAGAQVSALMLMADMLQINDRGRASLNALRLAESIQPRSDVIAALDRAIAKYGFRISEHRVDSDSATPRICAEFNEPLVKAGVDYATFLKLPDQRFAVVAQDREICIEGVEHGGRYSVTFRKGLPAASGETLIKDTELTLYVRDRSPAISFPGRAYVLPKTADAGLPIQTVNLDQVDMRLQRVSDRNLLRAIQDSYFGQPLSHWQLETFSAEIAETIWSGQGDVQNTLNADMTTRLPLGDIIADLPTGVYALTADLPGADKYDETSATQWFVLSDLGVTTLSGTDGLHVFVRGLADASAQEGTKVTLISRANRVLGHATTDVQGYARFDAGLTRGTNASAPALITLEQDQDFTFLSLTDPAFDLSDRGVEGRPPAPPIDVFLTTDRGAYRAGETVNVTALTRGEVAQALGGLPVTAILTRPDGVEYSRHSSTQDVDGGHVFSLPLGVSVPRGAWTLSLKSDLDAAALATAKFLVEDFLPERIDFDMSVPDGPLDAENEPEMSVTARYLFGAPGAGLTVEGQLTLRARSEIDGFSGYRFGRYDETFSAQTEYFGGDQTDADGSTQISLIIPALDNSGRPLQADITTRVLEGSGRPVERRMSHPVLPTGPLIGIKPLFQDIVTEGSDVAFEIIGLGKDLSPHPMDVRWTLNRVNTSYQWYNLYGNWEWEPTTTRTSITTGLAKLGRDPITVGGPVDWGRYELVVERIDGDYVASSTEFYAGWYAPADATDTPDTLELSLDKPDYRSGDTAQLRLVPRFSGTALVSVMSNRLISMQAVSVQEGENLIDLDVTDEWGAGAYVTASIIRPADTPSGHNPARALGLSYATVDPGSKQLAVRIDAPDKIAPNGALDVSIAVDGISAGETAHVTLAAVDVGILNLTGFSSPDPSNHYFGQRRLGMEIRDIYGRLIDGTNGNMGRLRSGGDAGNSARFQSPPPTEDLVAYFEGPITVGPNGTAQVQFDLPDFNGTVRLMAVAWSPTAVGQAEQKVVVRNPVVVTASVPRFLAPGDTSRLLLEIVHAEGPSGRMGLDVTATGLTLDLASVPSGITLGDKDTVRLSLPISAADVGDHSLRIALTTPDGKLLVKTLNLPVRSNDPETSTTQRITLAAGDTFTLDQNLFADLRSGTGSAVISSGALAQFDAPGLLQALDRYPYGCTEQITSGAMPLLYFDTITSSLGLGDRDQVKTRIDQAISGVLARQASNGAFGLWRAESGDFWLDAYVSDFLSRARAKGYFVPDLAFRISMDNLRNRVNYAPDFDNGGEDIAYALMILAREGAAAMGDLRYYADVKADHFATPLAAAQLGAALAFYGDQTRSDRLFRRAASLLEQRHQGAPDTLWRVDYGTDLRDTAAVLTLAVEAGTQSIDRTTLAARLGRGQHALSTQESAWSLMAAHALIDDTQDATITIDGIAVDGPLVRALADDVNVNPVLIQNTSATSTELTLTSVGVPDYPLERGGYGYEITRTYYTMQGTPISPDALHVGDRMVAVLRIDPFQKGGARLMVNDPLPAGLEIDNPNLLSSGDIREFDWLELTEATHSEFRSDRFLSAVDWHSDKPFQLAYVVRAVSPGSFHHPAASVEDMYRPQYRANTAGARILVQD